MQRTEDYVFLLGRGRSGTTWIGRVLNIAPGHIYKYEPFNPEKNSAYLDWLSCVQTSSTADLRTRFAEIVSTCQHDIDYPPFLHKPCRPQNPYLLRVTWQLGKLIPAFKFLFERYGRPRFEGAPAILLKQVNFPNELLPDVARVLSPRIVGVVRNPFSSASSALKYYRDRNEDPRSLEAMTRVRELLRMPGYESMRKYEASLETMTVARFETLRWRIQTEPLVQFIRAYPSAYLAIYERVAENPLEEFKKIYAFLNWAYTDNVIDFIESTSTAKSGFRNSRQEFSVHRNAEESLNKWRKNLCEEEQADVLSIFKDSPLYDLWPEIHHGS